MQELHSENPLKKEKHSKKKEKERNSHELEANCMGIAIDDAALEKHDEKKRYKMKEIEASEVVSLESPDEPESKEEEKTKRKREKSHKRENKERKSQEIEIISMEIGSGVTSQAAEASLETYDKKKGDIEADKDSVVVSREGSAKPESKSEKKKRKKEKSHKHENKERKSQEIEVISMEIGSGLTSQEAEASLEKYEKNKREIEADKDSVVVSREGLSKPESKTEKNKRKREKSHKHDKLEYSGVPSHEGFVELESKAEKKKKRKREKSGKHDKLEKKSQDIEDNSTQEAEAASEKHDKKKRRKNKEIYVDKDIQVVSQEGFTEELTKDKKRKKKSKKEKSEEEIDISSKESKPLPAEEKVKNKKQEKGKEVVGGGSESSRENVSGKERSFDDAETSKQKKPTQKKPRKSVSFSGNVEVFPLGNDAEADDNTEKPLVQGKRFTKDEDELLKNAVLKYIEVNQLGNEGLRMVLNCIKYPQARNCWRDIGLSIPWRPLESVYYRAHVLFERSEARKWEPHEYDTLMRLHKVHGANWRVIGEELGKHRFQAKDTWRRIENQNRRYGHWSQEEYQALFDLVNLDLTMKAHDEKKTKHGMLRDNISWKAIGKKMATRNFQSCCDKWYYQLASPLVKEGHWFNSDDYRLLEALEKQDACCVEDVDWDNLLKHRSGEYCQRRWAQMVRYIGGYREKSFIEQVEVLCSRYCPEMLKYRNEEALASGSSPHKKAEDGEQVKAP